MPLTDIAGGRPKRRPRVDKGRCNQSQHHDQDQGKQRREPGRAENLEVDALRVEKLRRAQEVEDEPVEDAETGRERDEKY